MESNLIPNVVMEIPREYSVLLDPQPPRYIIIEGGRYSLKSHTVARALLLRARMYYDKPLRIACLRQFQTNIGDSSHQLLVDLCEQYGLNDYTWTDNEISCTNGSTFIFKGLDRNVETTIKGLEGVDIFWIDEAQTISEKALRILVPTIRKKGAFAIFTMNRNTDRDPVIARFLTEPPREDVYHLYTTYELADKYGWLDEGNKRDIEYTRIHEPEVFAHDYLGKALNTSNKSIISLKSVMEAIERQADQNGAIEVGVDVARLGNDRTVFVKRKGLSVIERKTFTKLRTTEVCDQLEQFVDSDKEVAIKIDDTGVGGGVTDEMIRRGYTVFPMNFGGKAQNSEKYPNLISEAWFHLASIIDQIHLDNNSDLITELSCREWTMDTKGRRGVESKDTYKKRGYRSPDEADATILAFYEPTMMDFSDLETEGEYFEKEKEDDGFDDDDDDNEDY